MLVERHPAGSIAGALLPRADWQPFPPATQRAAWEALPADLRAARVAAGEGYLDFEWPVLPATVFLDFARNGNRQRFETLTFARRRAFVALVLAECVEGQGRFVDAIVDGLWALCEESFWGVPAHVGVQQAGVGLPDVSEPIVDLFAAETASHLAWAHYLLGEALDEVSPLLRARIEHEQRRRILDPLLQRDDFGWMGLSGQGRRVNNWNPWICSNWLATALLLESDESLRAAHVVKAMRCLDRFVDPYPRDGGCDEGPSYWGRAGASLFDCLDLLRSASGSAIDLFDEPLVGEIGRFLHRVHIADDYYVNFADAPAVVRPDPALVFRYGQAIGDGEMQTMGRWLAGRGDGAGGVPDSAGRALRTLFTQAEMTQQPAPAPLPRDVWLPEIEVMLARDAAGCVDGWCVAAKGGHNDESHNHNDIGEFVLYRDGLPVLVDAGVETYTRKTFSTERYDIWTMQTAYHNLPTVGGVQQLPGAQFAARDAAHRADDDGAELSLDLAAAYPEGTLTRWQRTVRLERRRGLAVEDDWELGPDGAPPLELSLITPCDVAADGNGLRLTTRDLAHGPAGEARLTWEIAGARWSVEPIELTDTRMRGSWGERLFRLRFIVDDAPRAGRWTLRVEAS
jgi:hypothetical protein